MSLEIAAVDPSGDLRRFVDVPWRLIDRDTHPQWVPPLRRIVRDALDRDGNPFYERAEVQPFLALRDGRVAGRIAAVENRAHNDFHGDRIGFYGFFECEEDQETADALFDAAAAWLRERGLARMRGPISPSTNHETGLLVRGFRHRPTILTPWNPPYYPELHEGAGLEGVKDLLGYLFLLERFELPERWSALADRARESRSISFRDFDLSRFDREVAVCWEIYNSAWEKNWGFVPMSRAEFEHQAREMKPLLIPDFGFIAEVDGEAAGFVLILPDFNPIFQRIGNGRLFPFGWLRILLGKRKLRFGRIMALGLKPEYRTRSIFPLFADEMYRRGMDYGAVGAEASWVLEDNDRLNRPLRKLGARAYRQWRLYERPL